MILVLGMKHGLDADHLATIDGLTRFNARIKPRLASICGALFSIGHGSMVIAISLAICALADTWQVPEWLANSGLVISVFFLLGLGVVNLRAVLMAKPYEIVRTVGFKSGWLAGIAETSQPFFIMLIGAMFAVSFDTVSLAALFAVAAKQFGGSLEAFLMGLTFMIGMLATDGINGVWIARLIRRTDDMALLASRVMGVAIAALSFGIAAIGLAKWRLPLVDAWIEQNSLWYSFTVILSILTAFMIASLVGRSACSE